MRMLSEVARLAAAYARVEVLCAAQYRSAGPQPIGRHYRAPEGTEVYLDILAQELPKYGPLYPHVEVAGALVDILKRDTVGRDTLHSLLRPVIKYLMKAQNKTLCQHYGFSGTQMHLQCPSCKTWGQLLRV
ncbi:MAG: hypothetical protein ACI9Y1_000026 [Lentisphaeria bacterium]|jgi:hypothetical protein